MTKLKIQKNKEKIVKLLNENIDFQYNLRLKSFKRVSEKMVNIGTKKDPKQAVAKVGHWFEWFYDEDFPKDKKHAVKIERREMYEIDGEKTNHWNKIYYYSVEDI